MIRDEIQDIRQQFCNKAAISMDDPIHIQETVNRLLDELERYQDIEDIVQQLAVAYKGEADRYDCQLGKAAPLVRFTRGRQDAYENMMRVFSESRNAQGEE